MTTISCGSRISSRSLQGMKGWTEEWTLSESITRKCFKQGLITQLMKKIWGFSSTDQLKRKEISLHTCHVSPHKYTHICPLSHCNSYIEFNGMHSIRGIFHFIFFFCSQCFLCWCLHSVVFFLLINLFDMMTAINYLHICLFIYLIEGWMV